MGAEQEDTPGAPTSRDLSFRYRFENAEFDEAQAALRVDGEIVAVEPRPLQLLAELLRRPNEVVTKDELFEAVWTGLVTVDHVLASAVNKLRKALGARAGARIVNVPRVGYRFSGTVERVVVGQVADAALNLQAGQAVPGREGYRLERPLDARGLVWLARHRQLNQSRVFKFATDAERLRSLKREFTLHRVLRAEDPEPPRGVARLVDANFAEPPFFLECEYEGPDLLTWALEDNRLAGMSVAERLALFIPVAEAVAAAHEVGVLHKDIKPANVLIGGEPGAWRPVITDFGSGHVLDAERLHNLGLTAMGLTVNAATDPHSLGGTAMYMAPELLAGHGATVKSDVYALGVMLYQLLAGDLRRPLATGWQRDVIDELLQEDISAATQGDAVLRLVGARELMFRLGRLKERQEQRGAATEAALQAARWRQAADRAKARRPWVAASLASVTLGMLVAVWYWRDAGAERQRAESAAAGERAVARFLEQDVLGVLSNLQTPTDRPPTLLDAMRRASERVDVRFADSVSQRVAIRRRLAAAFLRNDSIRDASREIEAAWQLAAKHYSERDDEMLELSYERATIWIRGFADDSYKLARDEIARLDAIVGGKKTHSNELELRALRAKALLQLHADKDHEGSIVVGREWTRIADSVPNAPLLDRIEPRQFVVRALLLAGRTSEAEVAIAALSEPPFNAPGVGAVTKAKAQMDLAAWHRGAGRYDEAERLLLLVIESLRTTSEPSGSHLGYAHSELGHVYVNWRQPERAATAYAQAASFMKASLGDDHQHYHITQKNRADAEMARGRPDLALPPLLDSAEWFSKNATGGRWLPHQHSLACALVMAGRVEEGQTILAELPSAARGTDADRDKPVHWAIDACRGSAWFQLGRRAEGRSMIRMARASIERIQGSDAWTWHWARTLPGAGEQEPPRAASKAARPP